MKFKRFDKYSWVVTILFVGSLISFFVISGSRLFINLNVPALGVGNYFYSDRISYYLIFLSVCLGISLLLLLEGVSNLGRFMILLSIVSSVLSYCCLQAVGF